MAEAEEPEAGLGCLPEFPGERGGWTGRLTEGLFDELGESFWKSWHGEP